MVDIIIYKNDKNDCVGFDSIGHAGFAEEGQDIVCAAVSVLTINTINAIDAFTSNQAEIETNESEGMIRYRILGQPVKETALLLETMILGLQTMVDDENYEEYIDLTFEEV